MNASGFGSLADGAGDSASARPTPTCEGLNGGSDSRRAAKRRGKYIDGSGDYSALARPTPTAHGNDNFVGASKKSGDGLHTAILKRDGCFNPKVRSEGVKARLAAKSGSTRSTPTAEDAGGSGRGRGHFPLNKQAQAASVSAWPTPTARDSAGCSPHEKERDKLCFAVERGKTKSHIYPTPRTRDLCGGTGAHEKIQHLANLGILDADEARALGAKMYPTITQGDVHIYPGGTKGQAAVCVGAQVRREALEKDPHSIEQLNPDWVEWLMNWPVGWTDTKAESLVWLIPEDDPAELPIGHPNLIRRVTSRKDDRTKRIITLGNGQVPLCAFAAIAWGFEILDSIINQ